MAPSQLDVASGKTTPSGSHEAEAIDLLNDHGQNDVESDGDDSATILDDATDLDSDFEPSDEETSNSDAVTVLNDPIELPNHHYDPSSYITKTSYDHFGATFRPGKTVELRNGDFLRITTILEDHDGFEVLFKGHIFRRNHKIENMLEKQRNEVTWLLQADASDHRSVAEQSMQTVALEDVVSLRVLLLTNEIFPARSYRDNPTAIGKDLRSISDIERLVCRWKLLNVSGSEGFLARLNESECTPGTVCDPKALRRSFRGPTSLGGSSRLFSAFEKNFDAAERARCHHQDPIGIYRGITSETLNLRYSLGDAYCGAGGTSRGAKVAGLYIAWGLENDPAAMKSYQKNFPEADCFQTGAHEFSVALLDKVKVDILHLSPPCQPFSPAHTRIGKRDEMNEATLLGVGDIIAKVKPRVVTIEETFGIHRLQKHKAWFATLVRMFTRLNFSVRWKIIDLRDFGLPQPRKRLVMIASCPGETLPDFPHPTHSSNPNSGLLPYITVHDAISGIPSHISLHNPDCPSLRRNGLPYDAHKPLANTITCASTKECRLHPSGRRNFTLREIACLQGFPLEHEFGDKGVRKQIGNAVPAIFAKALFQAITETLRRADGV